MPKSKSGDAARGGGAAAKEKALHETRPLPLPEDFQVRLRDCRRRPENEGTILGQGWSCKLEGWCGACTTEERVRRLEKFWAIMRRFGPAVRPSLAVLSFPVPGAKAPWREVVPPAKSAMQRAIAVALGFEGKAQVKVERVAWGAIGGFLKVDPLGGPRDAWPAWAPSIDLLLPLVERKEGRFSALDPAPLTSENLGRKFAASYKERVLPARQGTSKRALKSLPLRYSPRTKRTFDDATREVAESERVSQYPAPRSTILEPDGAGADVAVKRFFSHPFDVSPGGRARMLDSATLDYQDIRADGRIVSVMVNAAEAVARLRDLEAWRGTGSHRWQRLGILAANAKQRI